MDIERVLKAEFAKEYRSLRELRALCRLLGLSYQSTRAKHHKSDEKGQEAFKKLPKKLKEIEQGHPENKIELWCEDETGIGQKGSAALVGPSAGKVCSVD